MSSSLIFTLIDNGHARHLSVHYPFTFSLTLASSMATFSSHSSFFPLHYLPSSTPISPSRPTNLKLASRSPKACAPVEETGDKVKRFNGLSVLYDDGFGIANVKNYFAAAKEIVRPDGGPPRWFCPVECWQPNKDALVVLSAR